MGLVVRVVEGRGSGSEGGRRPWVESKQGKTLAFTLAN